MNYNNYMNCDPNQKQLLWNLARSKHDLNMTDPNTSFGHTYDQHLEHLFCIDTMFCKSTY